MPNVILSPTAPVDCVDGVPGISGSLHTAPRKAFELTENAVDYLKTARPDVMAGAMVQPDPVPSPKAKPKKAEPKATPKAKPAPKADESN